MATVESKRPRTQESVVAPIVSELQAVDRILAQQLVNKHQFVNELVTYAALLGGKRLRPTLLLLFAKATGAIREEHKILAAVVEMIHSATLIHDDVLDEAATRRHMATVNARWDNQASVLLGDYLFSQAFYLASTTGSAQACRRIGEATNRVCSGEIRQKGWMGNWSLEESEYVSVLEAKTGELCAVSCELGAEFAGGAESQIEAARKFGLYLGVAFQVTDDLLDYAGDENHVGKTLGTDLATQKPTLPVLHALETVSDEERAAWKNRLSNPDERLARDVMEFVKDAGALKYTQSFALRYCDLARHQLSFFPMSDARESLEHSLEFVVTRKH